MSRKQKLHDIFPMIRLGLGFSDASVGIESACDVGDGSLIPRSGRSHGGGNGNPVQYSCLKNPMDRGTWRAIVQRVTESQTQLSNFHFSKKLKQTSIFFSLLIFFYRLPLLMVSEQ